MFGLAGRAPRTTTTTPRSYAAARLSDTGDRLSLILHLSRSLTTERTSELVLFHFTHYTCAKFGANFSFSLFRPSAPRPCLPPPTPLPPFLPFLSLASPVGFRRALASLFPFFFCHCVECGLSSSSSSHVGYIQISRTFCPVCEVQRC